ncbi:keratin, type I cytoskeletal 19-like [Anomaloglossus baeobatrachus]|uniref:keratin, type I cytoskeletal 19-like n=1 Tax=Anomaloglossus baeobatrachus TaxID=238106 RepID=UPI003F50821F
MSSSGRKAWSSAGSFRGTYHFGGDPKKLSRRLSLPYHGGCSGTFSVLGGKKFRRTAQDAFRYIFGSESVHKSYGLRAGRSQNEWKNEGLLSTNSKETMTLLNDRLANYLEQVAELKEENNRLERKIQTWDEKNAPKELPNCEYYLKTIKELQKEILNATIANSQAVLHIDNARLAGDDLLNKYTMELSLRNNIEADIQALRKGLDGLTLEKFDLDFQINFLMEDLTLLKTSHVEEVHSLETQLGARVNVEVDAAPSADLSKILLEIRREYESLMEENMQNVENWFMTQSEELNQQMISGTEQLQTVKTEGIDLRHTLQTLEIDLQADKSKKLALEGSLVETEADYGCQLTYIQALVNSVEGEFSRLRYDLERQQHEYKILMDVRTRLEIEIATYRRLLQEEDMIPLVESTKAKGSRRFVKIVSITEEFEDGKFVSKQEQIHHL